ncbi:hypothetical protein FACS189440_16580 [Bacteroidia bacterium]|nr:hypothetical protein FACS189440_16580 [Bacteroidia bacterium]
MDVHPKKEYLQHYTKGFSFLGAYIKPFRRYISRRTEKNLNLLLYSTDWIDHYDFLTGEGREKRDEQLVSYLGLMQHFKAYKKTEQIRKFL